MAIFGNREMTRILAMIKESCVSVHIKPAGGALTLDSI